MKPQEDVGQGLRRAPSTTRSVKKVPFLSGGVGGGGQVGEGFGVGKGREPGAVAQAEGDLAGVGFAGAEDGEVGDAALGGVADAQAEGAVEEQFGAQAGAQGGVGEGAGGE
jgi:hypothetical protein